MSDTGYDRRGKELAPDENPSAGRQLLEFVITLVVAFAIAFALRTFVVQPYVVPTGSMLPTIQLEDQLLAIRRQLDEQELEEGLRLRWAADWNQRSD